MPTPQPPQKPQHIRDLIQMPTPEKPLTVRDALTKALYAKVPDARTPLGQHVWRPVPVKAHVPAINQMNLPMAIDNTVTPKKVIVPQNPEFEDKHPREHGRFADKPDALKEKDDEQEPGQPATEPEPPKSLGEVRQAHSRVKQEIGDQDGILLMRQGDHYHTFGPDADKVRTAAGVGDGNIASFAHDDLVSHIGKLVGAGHRVAIAEHKADAPPPNQEQGHGEQVPDASAQGPTETATASPAATEAPGSQVAPPTAHERNRYKDMQKYLERKGSLPTTWEAEYRDLAAKMEAHPPTQAPELPGQAAELPAQGDELPAQESTQPPSQELAQELAQTEPATPTASAVPSLSADHVLDQIGMDPAHAEQWGIRGQFYQTQLSLDQVKQLNRQGHLRIGNQIDPDNVARKAASDQYNPLVISQGADGALLLADGAHSLLAANRNGRQSMSVLLSEDAARALYPQAEAVEQPADDATTSEHANAKAPWQQTAEEFASSGAQAFTTSQGSLYAYNNGQSIRVKTPHQGHDAGDVGLKRGSHATRFVDPQDAQEVGMWGTMSNSGKRIIMQGDTMLLTSINPSTGERGLDKRIQTHNAPQVGLAPVELFDPNSEGHYKGHHPGNAITGFVDSKQAHAHLVDAARKAGKDTTGSSQSAPGPMDDAKRERLQKGAKSLKMRLMSEYTPDETIKAVQDLLGAAHAGEMYSTIQRAAETGDVDTLKSIEQVLFPENFGGAAESGSASQQPPPPPPAPTPSRSLRRRWSAGANSGTIEFENDLHQDLYDLGAKQAYQARGGQNRTHQRPLGDLDAMRARIAKQIGTDDEGSISQMAREVYADTKEQMRGMRDGEHRKVFSPIGEPEPEMEEPPVDQPDTDVEDRNRADTEFDTDLEQGGGAGSGGGQGAPSSGDDFGFDGGDAAEPDDADVSFDPNSFGDEADTSFDPSSMAGDDSGSDDGEFEIEGPEPARPAPVRMSDDDARKHAKKLRDKVGMHERIVRNLQQSIESARTSGRNPERLEQVLALQQSEHQKAQQDLDAHTSAYNVNAARRTGGFKTTSNYGQMIHAHADTYGLNPDDLHATVLGMHDEAMKDWDQRDKSIESLRQRMAIRPETLRSISAKYQIPLAKLRGITKPSAKAIEKWEAAGLSMEHWPGMEDIDTGEFDSSDLAAMGLTGRDVDVQMQHTSNRLGFQDQLWQLFADGAGPRPHREDPELIRKAAEFLERSNNRQPAYAGIPDEFARYRAKVVQYTRRGREIIRAEQDNGVRAVLYRMFGRAVDQYKKFKTAPGQIGLFDAPKPRTASLPHVPTHPMVPTQPIDPEFEQKHPRDHGQFKEKPDALKEKPEGKPRQRSMFDDPIDSPAPAPKPKLTTHPTQPAAPRPVAKPAPNRPARQTSLFTHPIEPAAPEQPQAAPSTPRPVHPAVTAKPKPRGQGMLSFGNENSPESGKPVTAPSPAPAHPDEEFSLSADPHQAEPQPEPQPAPRPEPQPEPQPAPQPAPQRDAYTPEERQKYGDYVRVMQEAGMEPKPIETWAENYRRVQAMKKPAPAAQQAPQPPAEQPKPAEPAKPLDDYQQAHNEAKGMSREEFAKKYRQMFAEMSKYTPEQAGMKVFSDRMAGMADAHPDWADEIENEGAPLTGSQADTAVDEPSATRYDQLYRRHGELVKQLNQAVDGGERQRISDEIQRVQRAMEFHHPAAIARAQAEIDAEQQAKQPEPPATLTHTKKSLHTELTELADKLGKTVESKHFEDGRLGYLVDGVHMTPGEAIDHLRAAAQAPGASPQQAAPRQPQKPQAGPAPTNPHIALANMLAEKLRNGEQITANDLFAAANEAHGGTRAEGRYGPSDAYDSLEAGFNKALDGATDPTADLDGALQQVQQLAERVSQLPTQTNRSGNKNSFQQFSTPPHYAFAANWIANLSPNDTVLEPSAGTGSLAIHAKNAGANVVTNELDKRRAAFLADQFGKANVHNENADHIGAILPKKGVAPTAVVMNPPFSQTAGRLGDKKDLLTGARHIEQGLQILGEGGRLVAIVGRGMTPESPTYREWFNRMKAKYNLRANVGVSGDEYKKYGTHFDTRVLVFDKSGPHQGETVTGDVDDIPSLMQTLEGVRNDRPQVDRGASGEQTGGVDAATAARPENLRPVATDAGIPGTSPSGIAADGLPGRTQDGGALAGDKTAAVGSGTAGGELSGVGGGTRSGSGGQGVAGAKRAPKRPVSGNAGGSGFGGTAGGEPVQQPQTPNSRLRPPERIAVTPLTAEQTAAQQPKSASQPATGSDDGLAASSSALYENYQPSSISIAGAKPHETAIVESSAMAAVRAPGVSYSPMLSPDLVESGALSVAQLESVVYAGHAHGQYLPSTAGDVGHGKTFVSPDGEFFHLRTDQRTGQWELEGSGNKLHAFNNQQEAEAFLTQNGWTNEDGSDIKREATPRKGYFIGDGTGVGKGRQLAGIIADNWNQGRKKHVWVTEKQSLYEDAHRDWAAMGMPSWNMIHFDKIRNAAVPPKEGVAFITYDTLKMASKDPTKPNNLKMLADWLGPDFDGVIAFDEAHGMANALESGGGRGTKKPSQKALSGVELQSMLPNARVIYASATGATDVANLAYADRLGIWGRETPFTDKKAFINEMEQGGVAAMEAVAQSLKATGSYTARSLSLDDGTEHGRVEYDRVTHKLDPDQREQYDAAADAWQTVLAHIDKALEATGGSGSSHAKMAAKSQFWGAQQRFFNQVMTAMQTPSVIDQMEKDIANGHAPVVQLVNTMEAATKRARERLADDADLEEMDVTPREVLMKYLEASFPIHKYEEYVDQNGNTQSRLVVDANGDPVVDPVALEMRNELMAAAGALRIPDSPLDMILNHFGHENVAECTGRTQRLIYKRQEDGELKRVMERRNSKSANASEASAFQSGKKKILIFSDAGGTGRSYHADRNAENQKKRQHYMLQPGWRADKATQGLGRTHRTNQASAPRFRLVEIEDLKAQKRFVSTIARRLDQMGALTRGQRQAGSSGLFNASDNLESPEAREALGKFFRDLQANKIDGLSFSEVMRQMGFEKQEEDESKRGRAKQVDTPPMGQFLNRLLSLRVDMQGQVFEEFDKRLKQTVEQAIREGTLDTGVEDYPADSISHKSETTVFRDKQSSAEARHIVTSVKRKTEKRPFDQNVREKPLSFVRNKQSGRVWAVYKWVDKTDTKSGKVFQQYALRGPGSSQYRPTHEVSAGFEQISEDEARQLWEDEYSELPDYSEREEHFLIGALLPIWDRIPASDKPKIYRLKTEDGRTVVGRHVPRKLVPELMKNLGVNHEPGQKTHKVADVHAALSKGRIQKAVLANGWHLKPARVQNEKRIELVGPSVSHMKELAADGVIREVINYQTRFFVPTGEEGARVLERITKARPIVDADEPEQYGRSPEAVLYELFRPKAQQVRYGRSVRDALQSVFSD